MKTINSLLFTALSSAAKTSPRLRQHHNFHEKLDEPCQRLLIAMEPGSYLQPHRHLRYPKPEMFVALRGAIGVLTFSDTGDVVGAVAISPNRETVGVEVSQGVWHTALALEEGSVFMEVKSGPYHLIPDEDRASWAPGEGSCEARAYLEKITAEIRRLADSRITG
jgi:cupin fold WbuC family metalloprotein